MRTLLKFPFCRVDGLELSEHIASIAARNFRRLGADRSTVFAGDASTFQDYDNYNYAYFYNPFPTHVMRQVVGNLVGSIERRPRRFRLIYDNPTCHDAVMRVRVFAKVGDYPDVFNNRIFVYSSTEPGADEPTAFSG